MEVKLKYKAKNGMEFDDPYMCEQYEKMLDYEDGTVGYFLKNLEQFDDEDYFDGTLCVKAKDSEGLYYSRKNLDFSDLYEGEFITQTMKEAQERATTKVKDVRDFFGKFDADALCGGLYAVYKAPNAKYSIWRIPCDKVFNAVYKEPNK